MTSTIAVIGAAGGSGTALLGALQGSTARARALVHGDEGARRALAAGADEAVTIDLAESSTIVDAIEGADAVYMIPPSFHPDEDTFAVNAMRAAEAAAVSRFVYVSVLHSHTPTMRHHMRKARAEAVLRSLSLEWTVLQPAIYAQTAWAVWASGPPGVVQVPFDTSGTFALIDLADLSEVAVKVLLDDGHVYATYELAGDSATMEEHVATAARVRGVELTPQRIAPADVQIPPPYSETPSSAQDMRAMFDEYDHHGFLGNSTVLAALLGRAPRTFEDVVRRML